MASKVAFRSWKRVQNDVNQVLSNSTDGIQGELEFENDFSTLLFVIDGPADSIFKGGKYRMRMRIPSNYPMKPPSCQFLTEMWHPNVYRDGKICLDTLQSSWVAGMSLGTVVMTILALLTQPNPSDPANSSAGRQYDSDRPEYNKRVQALAKRSHQDWTKWMTRKVVVEDETSAPPSSELTDTELAEVMAAVAAADSAADAASDSSSLDVEVVSVEEGTPPRTKRPRAL